MKSVQIPESLWRDLVDYFILDNVEVSDRIKLQINAKLDKQIAREQYMETHFKKGEKNE